MTPAEWAEFVALGIAGAFGLFSLFDGTRRMAARQAGAGRTTLLGATIAGMLVAYSYWHYSTYSEAARWYQWPGQTRELPADWGKKMSPAKRETASQGIARQAFIGSGTLTQYFDASGQRRAYAPAQDDLKRREALLAAAARMEQKALSSFNEFILWLVLGLSAFVFGLLFSFESAPRPEPAEEDTKIEPVLAPPVAVQARPLAAPPKPAVGVDTVPLPKPRVGGDTVPLPKPGIPPVTAPLARSSVGEDTVPIAKPAPGTLSPPPKKP